MAGLRRVLRREGGAFDQRDADARGYDEGDRNDRAQWMGAGKLAKWITSRPEELPVGENATWTVVANGPVGHCYAPGELSRPRAFP